MASVSVIIPSRNEQFLTPTVNDILKNATGDVEVIAIIDGNWPSPFDLPDDKRLTIIHPGRPRGMRWGINAGAAVATGDYLMKCDAHCAFEEGFDEVLAADCEGNWVVIPRRDRLDAENWTRRDVGKIPIDYHYLSCPITNRHGYSMHGTIDNGRAQARSDPEYDIDETMSFQGSCWFMDRRHFFDRLGGMSEFGYGTFTQEPQEIGMKTWLGGGKLMVNKKTTYLHLHKGRKYGRGYAMGRREVKMGHYFSAVYWMSNSWEERAHDIEWLVEKFWRVPTWPGDWMQRRFEFEQLETM